MAQHSTPVMHNSPATGIAFVLVGILAITINDTLIKFMSGDYPLHQMIFIRSAIGLTLSLALVQWEGGFFLLKTQKPWLHVLRGLLVVIANLSYFTALAVVPLADATALFLIAPLMITLLSIPLLGEKVGPLRIGAVFIGFAGVLIMLRPWDSGSGNGAGPILLLPVFGALAYSLNQLLTRKLGATTRASALAVYIQATFVLVSTIFFLGAGDGRFATGVENESLQFLLRAWIWPQGFDVFLLLALGVNAAVVGYAMSQAYRLADAATVAPYEYTAVPLALFWGWLIWGEVPVPSAALGMALIIGAGLFVFLREQHKRRRIASEARINRRY